MIAKKNPKFNEDQRRGIYFQLGLMVVSAGVLMAFSWRSPIHVESNVPIAERGTEIPEIKVHEEIEKNKVIEPKVEKITPIKKLQLKMTKDLNKDLKVIQNQDKDIQSSINDDRFKHIIDGDFDVDIGDRPVLNDVVKFPKVEAHFQGDWLNFLRKTVVYPDYSQQVGDQGKIYVSFIVERDGTISDAKVANKKAPIELQREALRVVNSAPKWIPGIDETGEYVRTYKTVLINFVLR
jgi:protein TonB